MPKTKRKRIEEPTLPIMPEPEPPTESVNAPPEEKRVGFAWYVRPDGSINLDRTRESTIESLKEFLRDSKVQEILGFAPASQGQAAPSPVDIFPQEFSGSIYDGIGLITAAVASRLYHLPLEQCKSVLLYSNAEKNVLAAPTAAVINKYASSWMVKFKEEFALALLLSSMMLGKFMALAALASSARQRATAPNPNPTGPEREPARVVTVEAETQTEANPN